MHRAFIVPAVAAVCGIAVLRAQPVFTGSEVFPPEEFAARRASVMARIGDAVAILQGTTERPGEQALRQNNQFFYLTGVVEPRAIVTIDGRSKKTTLYLLPRNERREQRTFGPGLYPGPEAAASTGIEQVRSRDEFAAALAAFGRDARRIYTPFRPEVLGEASSSDPAALWRATKADLWDGRISREEQFVEKLKAAAPQASIADLDPIVDALRTIKSPREIAVIREATRITGLGIVEAMRDAKPGMKEYELQADAFVESYRRSRATALGHSVGMEVHDVTAGAPTSLEPGMIFTIEPAMPLVAEHLGVRLEDMLLITDTGYENMSAFVPIEIDAIERVMTEPGLSDAMGKGGASK